MNWFRRSPPAAPPTVPGQNLVSAQRYRPLSAEDQQADQDALERGDLPSRVRSRLEATRAGDRPWLSTLDISDWYFARGLRIEPVGQVAGSAYYHVATDGRGRELLDGNSDAINLIRGYYAARDLAVDRLIQEARLAAAHAIIDAKIHVSRRDRVIEASIMGTAIRWPEVARPSQAIPVSPLSGEEFFKLAGIGWLPVGLAFGYHWHVMPVGYRTRQISGAWWGANQELTSVAERFSRTREIAVQMLQRDAARMGATGVAGVHIDTHVEETEILYTGGFPGQYLVIDNTNYLYEDNGTVEVPAFNLEFFTTGAAIRRLGRGHLTANAIATYLDTI